MTADLKPCPFCGHTAHISELKQASAPSPRYFVECSNQRGDCIASASYYFGRRFYTAKDAAEHWNRRTEKHRVLTLEEVLERDITKDYVWIEEKGTRVYPGVVYRNGNSDDPDDPLFELDLDVEFIGGVGWGWQSRGYGKWWRCWDKEPTKEECEATKWDE